MLSVFVIALLGAIWYLKGRSVIAVLGAVAFVAVALYLINEKHVGDD